MPPPHRRRRWIQSRKSTSPRRRSHRRYRSYCYQTAGPTVLLPLCQDEMRPTTGCQSCYCSAFPWCRHRQCHHQRTVRHPHRTACGERGVSAYDVARYGSHCHAWWRPQTDGRRHVTHCLCRHRHRVCCPRVLPGWRRRPPPKARSPSHQAQCRRPWLVAPRLPPRTGCACEVAGTTPPTQTGGCQRRWRTEG